MDGISATQSGGIKGGGMMKMTCVLHVILLTLLVALPLSAGEVETTGAGKYQDIQKLFRLLKVTDLQEQKINQMFASMKKSMPFLEKDFWDRTSAQMKIHLHELNIELVSIYDKHLSHEEIKGLLEFYATPIGKRFIEVQPALTQESTDAALKWGQKIGAEMSEELEALQKEKPE